MHGPQGKYVLKLVSDDELYRGRSGGRRNYAHAVVRLDPEAGEAPLDLAISLQPGATVGGQIVDESGKAIDKAFVFSRLDISPLVGFWRTASADAGRALRAVGPGHG